MAEEHQAGLAELFCHGQALFRPEAGAIEGFLEVDLGAAPGIAWNAKTHDLVHDAVAIPAGGQRLGPHEHVALVGGVLDVRGNFRYAESGQL